jgi:hypothetical protein
MLSLRHPTAAAGSARKHFRIVLIKPSHYDDDGYVIRWYRSPMPANSLASVYGLIDDCARRHILGSDTDIEIVAIDETNTRARIDRIISEMRANNNFGFVGLVGVQSNQYPRSLHIAKPLREVGVPVNDSGGRAAAVLLLLYYLADSTITLLRRALNREPVWPGSATAVVIVIAVMVMFGVGALGGTILGERERMLNKEPVRPR